MCVHTCFLRVSARRDPVLMPLLCWAQGTPRAGVPGMLSWLPGRV